MQNLDRPKMLSLSLVLYWEKLNSMAPVRLNPAPQGEGWGSLYQT
jgi:hypothetical protein